VIIILKPMENKLDHIVKTTLARPSLQEMGREELLMLTHEFPYTSVLQFLYTKKLQQSQDPRFGNSVTRTALFFNNPHWLNQQLRETTAVERVRDQDVQHGSMVDSGMLSSVAAPDTLENEGIPDHRLSMSEQALIDSITEAPDGSLQRDEAEILAMETLEHESGLEDSDDWAAEATYIDEPETSDEFPTSTDFASEDNGTVDQEIEETEENDPIPADLSLAAFHHENSAASKADVALFEEKATQDPTEDADNPDDATQTFEETDTPASDLSSFELLADAEDEMLAVTKPEDLITEESEITSPSVDEFTPSESEELTPEFTGDSEINSTPANEELSLSASEESIAEIETDALDEGEHAPPDVTPQPPSPSSLITVIASVEPREAHSIHTIGLSEEADNDDDAVLIVDAPLVVHEPITAHQPSGAEILVIESPAEMAEDAASDNDDDSAVEVNLPPVDAAEISRDVSEYGSEDEPHASGLEHVGFQPETLLEESDAAGDESGVEGSPISSTLETVHIREGLSSLPEYEAEDSDHPDATEPGGEAHYDHSTPGINPGDLIKMAGLDQHTETELSFEPLHLTDYFASVGVSLSSDELPDVFSRQSRSFTGWIRSMKRIHPEKSNIPFTLSESEEIRNVAEQSNEQEEVLTETMAGIYALQGLTHKAIDIYEKLSLLNPEKSGIFAPKLSELKGKLP